MLELRLKDAQEILETAGQQTVQQEIIDKAVTNLNLAVAQLEKKKTDQEEEPKTKSYPLQKLLEMVQLIITAISGKLRTVHQAGKAW